MQNNKTEKTILSEYASIKQKNTEIIINAISGLKSTISYEVVSEELPKLIALGTLSLNLLAYKPQDSTITNGINRYLIYDHPDKANPFSIWVFAFASRQKTCIHDHKYKGTVTVLQGPISEKFYKPTGANSAQLAARIDRHRFHTNKDDLMDTFVHQLKCRKGLGVDTSITMHIYNMEAHVLNQENKLMDRRNLDTIYSKDKIIDKNSIPPYKEEYALVF